MKKFLIYLISLFSFKKLILPLIIRFLNIFFTVRTSTQIVKFITQFAGLFKFLNALLGLLLFLNMFDFNNIITLSGLITVLNNYAKLIIDNIYNLYNKIKPSGGNNHNFTKVNSENPIIQKLSEYVSEAEDKFESLRATYKHAKAVDVPSIFESWMFWLGCLFLIFLLGSICYFDNPIKSCVKGANKTSSYVRTPEGEVIYQESFLRRWLINPVKSLFHKDKVKSEEAELGFVHYTPVNTENVSEVGTSTFSRLFKKLYSPRNNVPQHTPNTP